MGSDVYLWPKGVSVKLLVWYLAAVKMQLIKKIFSTILRVKNTIKHKFKKIISCIFTAARNHTSNFMDTPFGHK